MKRSPAMERFSSALCVSFFLLAVYVAVTSGLAIPGPRGEAISSEIRRAMQLTLQSDKNITAAYQACSLWDSLLLKDGKNEIPANIRVLTLAMQASCLVRVGRDAAALPVYDEALSLQSFLDGNSRDDLIVEKASSLQRLLLYEDATIEFLKGKSERAVLGAATCALRVGELDTAARILFRTVLSENKSNYSEIHGMAAVVDFLLQSNVDDVDESIVHRLNATSKISPLYRWVANVYTHNASSINNTNTSTANETGSSRFSFLDFASVNNGAFDDPLLEILDDKLRLHQLLSHNTRGLKCEFYPYGLILPAEASRLTGAPLDLTWVCKSRSGYGSHGNSILSTSEAAKYAMTMEKGDEYKLLQKMVEPPLLLRGRKFSLRVYVVYLVGSSTTASQVIVMENGLVKVASIPFATNIESTDDSAQVHMTNSGREAAMQQHDFSYLKTELSASRVTFERVWEKIKDSVRTLFLLYHDEALRMVESGEGSSHLRKRVGCLGLPKILGFDYTVDTRGQPWLLEVNRFPGLEPRDASDLAAKHEVVREAWRHAARRQGWDDVSWLEWVYSPKAR